MIMMQEKSATYLTLLWHYKNDEGNVLISDLKENFLTNRGKVKNIKHFDLFHPVIPKVEIMKCYILLCILISFSVGIQWER